MKHLIKIIALISALCLVLGMLSGCNSVQVEFEAYDSVVDVNAELSNVKSGVVAETDAFTMTWNSGEGETDEFGNPVYRAVIEFVSKKDGKVWGTTPKQYLDSADASNPSAYALINSPLSLNVRSGEQTFPYTAYESSISKGRYSSELLEDKKGMAITYYFDEIGVVITAKYYLEGEGFKVSVAPTDVKCYSVADVVQTVIDVTPAPFVCGTRNTAAGDKNTYVVLPSGSGAIMYTDQRTEQKSRNFSGMFYGEDPTIDKYDNPKNYTNLTMPFYGIKDGNSALCAIIEQGSEACTLNASAGGPQIDEAGNPQIGYSYINTAYNLAGYNRVYSAGTWRYQYSEQVEQNLTPLVIGYYPLEGENADYNGMAKLYQKHLVDNEGLKKSQDNSLLSVKIFGSYVEDDLILGIPKDKNVALTTYDEATEILSELKEVSGGSLLVNMNGYGDGGINATKLAGGYTLTGVVGNKTDLKEFLDYTQSNNIKTFFSFDTIKFGKSTKGYSTKSDVANNINGIPAPIYQYWHSTRERYTKAQGGRVSAMIARDQLAAATGDAVEFVDKYGITGIAFDTLGNVCYSDYSKVKGNKLLNTYPIRNNMGADVETIVADTKAKGKTVLMDGAYSYAATVADAIANAPTASNRDDCFDLEVPLYQMVYQGYKAISVGSINVATNRRNQFLKAIESGSGLSFDLMANYYQELRKQHVRGLHASLYEDNKTLINEYVTEGKDFLTSVAGATITRHEYLTAEVTKTMFSNGVTVIVNFGDTDYQSELGLVKAQGFKNS